MIVATAETSPQLARSVGHLAFFGPFEYWQAGQDVYRASLDNVMEILGRHPDGTYIGRRFGRFECPAHQWPTLSERLTTTYAKETTP